MPDFSAIAIVAAYNEADIIVQVVADLIAQGIHVYLLDDGSTDGTIAAVEPYLGRGVLQIERLRKPHPANVFGWEEILLRKTQLARDLDADWFIHHDADEFRESPWQHLKLLDAIRRVDALGFNAIDFASFDFWPTDDSFRPGADVRETFPYYSEHAAYDRLQIRCWKKTDHIDLAASGGHDARFPNRSVFPLRFILRHYPIRSQEHGERKVFRERQNRFLDRERVRGWHVQYDHIEQGASFVRNRAGLTRFDGDAIRIALSLRHRGLEELESTTVELRQTIDTLRLKVDANTRELAAMVRELERQREAVEHAANEVAMKESEAAQLRADVNVRAAALARTEDQTAPPRHGYRRAQGRDRAACGRSGRAGHCAANIERRSGAPPRRRSSFVQLAMDGACARDLSDARPGRARTGVLMPGDVFLVLAEFGRQSEDAALGLLIPTVERVFPGATLHTIVVDGAATAAPDHEIAPYMQYMRGDNSLRRVLRLGSRNRPNRTALRAAIGLRVRAG